jgi:hypothetical protein
VTAVTIEAFDANAHERVFDFLDRAVAARGRRHWEWKYRSRAGEASAFYWVEPDGKVLGFIGLMRTSLHAGERQHPAAWFVDWHVIPGDRGVGVGLGLLRKAEAAAGVLLTLQGSADTQQILPRLRWKQSLSPVTWVLPVSWRFIAALAARRVPPWLSGTARVAGLASLYFRCPRPAALTGATLVDVERFPPAYDAVWHDRAAELAPTMRRDSTYVNFLCADYPEGGYHLQLVRWHGETVGHLVWRLDSDRRGFQRGRIVDAAWPRPHSELGIWVVASACWQLQHAGADYIECVLSLPELRDAVRGCRFRARTPVPLWYHRLPADVPDPDRWHITFLDCDRAYR